MQIISRLFQLFFLIFLLAGCNNQHDKRADNNITPAQDNVKKLVASKIENPYVTVDVSPMDMSYFPTDYPILKMNKLTQAPPSARVIYSRPHLQGRYLFKNLLKYGEPWRLGANESTEIDFYKDVIIQDKKIKAGRYVIYSIPDQKTWTIILNSNIDSWGLHPDSTKNIMQFTLPLIQTENQLEYFTMVFEKTTTGAVLIMAWENLEIRLPITF